MSSAGFEPTITAIASPQAHAVNRAATGSGTQADTRYTCYKRSPILEHFFREWGAEEDVWA
jgi:hypothetical protein